MLLLPTFNATLTPCPVGPAAFSAHEKGHFCGSCQRVVQDFSQSRNPVADLVAARAITPDGRVCGMFQRAQTTAPPPLTQRLRWFLALVLGQGLTAREAADISATSGSDETSICTPSRYNATNPARGQSVRSCDGSNARISERWQQPRGN